jgi:tyrosyl-tRNA synthetase
MRTCYSWQVAINSDILHSEIMLSDCANLCVLFRRIERVAILQRKAISVIDEHLRQSQHFLETESKSMIHGAKRMAESNSDTKKMWQNSHYNLEHHDQTNSKTDSQPPPASNHSVSPECSRRSFAMNRHLSQSILFLQQCILDQHFRLG